MHTASKVLSRDAYTRAYDNAADPKMHRDNNDSEWINLSDGISNRALRF